MKISQDQITELYKFTRLHFVEHYDLQTELVDHLANGIEEQWEKSPNEPFHQALQNEFAKFGIFGFHYVIGEKTRAMEKRYWKIFLEFYREFFKLPKVLLLFGGTILLFMLLRATPIKIGIYIPGGLLFVFLLTMLVMTLVNRKKQKKKDKKWLLEDIIAGHGNSLVLLNLIVQIIIYPRWFESVFNSPIATILVSFMVVLISLLFYVIINVIPKKAEEFLSETYPEYKMT